MKPIVLLCAHLGPHLSLAAPHISLAGLAGKPECPCISSSSSGFEQLQRDLAAVGLPQDYGTQGCQAYDRGANHGGIDCLDNAHDYCENKWCYVDMDLCSRNREKCEAAGKKLGSDASPYCRTRPHSASTVFGGYWSYETCGYLNSYNRTGVIQAPVAATVLKIAVHEWDPWLIKSPDAKHDFSGPTFDFFRKSVEEFSPEPEINVIDASAMAESLARFDSIYTACVHDVAIGNLDLCVSDLWVLPERALMAQFLPALRHDYFYLVVRKTIRRVSIWERLATPFRSRRMGDRFGLPRVCFCLWLALLCMQGQYDEFLEKIEWATLDEEEARRELESAREDLDNARDEPQNKQAIAKAEAAVREAALKHAKKERIEADLEAGLKNNNKLKLLQFSNLCQWPSVRENVHLLGSTWYDVWAHFLGQDMIYEGEKTQGSFKLFSLAFAFFSIVTLATYTASLASMLVAKQQPLGEFSTVEDAIARQYKLCVPDVLRTSIQNTYPDLVIVPCKEIQLCPRQMQLGHCQAMIVSEEIITRMHARTILTADCKENSTFCDDYTGKPRNDCDLIRVGYVLTSVPIAFPASQRLIQSFSWAFSTQHAKGAMQQELRAHSHQFPKSVCDIPSQQENLALGASDLSGIVIISGFFSMLALVRFVIKEYNVHKDKKKYRDKMKEDRKRRGRVAPSSSRRMVVGIGKQTE